MSKQLYVPYGANIEQGLDVKGTLNADVITQNGVAISGTVHTDSTLTGDGSVGTPLGESGWYGDAKRWLFSKNTAFTEFTPFRAGVSAGSSAFSDGGTEGGSGTPTGFVAAAKLSIGADPFQNPSATPFGVIFRAKFTGAPSSHICDIGLSGSSVDLVLVSNSANDATHFYFEADGQGGTTLLPTGVVIDFLWHDFAFYTVITPTPTLYIYIDGVQVFSTTNFTHFPSISCAPALFQQVANQILIARAGWASVSAA